MSAPINPPAFPISEEIWATHPDFHGMTLRDWFAGQIAAAEVASAGANIDAAEALADAAVKASQSVEQRIAFNAYNVADAMLAARGAA